MKWKYKDTGEGAKNLTYEDAEYLARTIINKRAYNIATERVGADGTTLADYVSSLLADGLSYEDAEGKLKTWVDSEGDGLTDDEITLVLMGV